MHSLGYVHPAVFDWYREVGETMGFRKVEAGPLVPELLSRRTGVGGRCGGR